MRCVFAENGETGEIVFSEDGVFFEARNVRPDYVIFRSFVNAHTHLGDSVVKEPPKMSLEELVGPGGFKFRVLSSVGRDEMIKSMAESIELAYKSGTTEIIDFREGGVEGYRILKSADRRGIVKGLARPTSVEEAEVLSKEAYGFCFSSTRDHDLNFLEECREIAKKRNIIFAIHAGEKDGEDVEDALALEPDVIVHMNMADRKQIRAAMDEGIMIVSCPRSNAFFGVFNLENLKVLSEYENWFLGTDNVMISTPSILDEAKFVSCFLPEDVVYRAAARGDKFVVARIDKIRESRDLIRSVVRRLESCDIVMISEISFE